MDSSSNDVFSFLKEIAANKISCDGQTRRFLRQIARSDSTPETARFLSSQLLFRFEGQFIESDLENEFLVAGFFEECDGAKLSALADHLSAIPWSPLVVRAFLRGYTKRNQVPELATLQRVWIELHRFWHHHRLAESVRWCLQTLYDFLNRAGQCYWETFRFYLLDVQKLVKHRYLALALLIPKLSDEEVVISSEILFYDLKECQKHQHLSSITSECVVAIGKRMLEDQRFYDFLLGFFLSDERQVRYSSQRYWIAQFVSNKQFKPVLSKLMNLLRTPKPIEADRDTENLTDIDFFWGLNEKEVDSNAWDHDDRRLLALLVVIQASTRCFGYQHSAQDVSLIRSSLRHRRATIRIEALNLATESDIEGFIMDNAATDDSKLREAIKKRVNRWTISDNAKKRAEGWLEKDSNHQRITFVLDLAEKKGLKLSPETLRGFSRHSDPDVRRKSLNLLRNEDGFVEFLTSAFVDSLSLGNDDISGSLFDALVRAEQTEFLANHANSVSKVLQISIESKLVADVNEFLTKCAATVEENLALSGSSKLGECSSMAELNSRMEMEKSLLISEKCTDNISSYAGVLIGCSKTMVDRVVNESVKLRLRVLRLIWTVLLRSRHKGVVDDCATQFERLRAKCSDEETSGILEETMVFFGDDRCSSRNLAFWRILLCFPNQIDTLFEKFIFHLSSKSDTVVIRSLKALKAFLGNSKYSADCEKFYARILRFILQEYSQTSWAVRSAMNHTFEVLVHALFSRIPSNVPLFNFSFDYPEVWDVVTAAVNSLHSAMDPQTVLILSVLERILLVDQRFYLPEELERVRAIRSHLLEVYSTSKQIRISELIVDCLLNLVPLHKWTQMEDLLNEKLEKKVKRASDHFCVVHAIRRISKELWHPVRIPVDHYFDERKKLDDGHPLNNLETSDVDAFASMAVSAKELNRLCAAFSLSHQWTVHPMSLRLFCISVCLLLDETESIRMRACKALVNSDSSSPVMSPPDILRLLAEKLTKEKRCSRDDLLKEWKTFVAEEGGRVKRYNRYFEEFVVEEILNC
ncbi:hypothetical protein QR680_012452 [Steinernema hermaphroditum]|uniref:DUF2428 domain-containing protein n=1 Tax=Steinernema hermaphroditum TaxID=289476 RepID=A0AA39I416_9BILA|nr:hypothetical protein QR680_012452 [Steinernema hermaphroditum]